MSPQCNDCQPEDSGGVDACWGSFVVSPGFGARDVRIDDTFHTISVGDLAVQPAFYQDCATNSTPRRLGRPQRCVLVRGGRPSRVLRGAGASGAAVLSAGSLGKSVSWTVRMTWSTGGREPGPFPLLWPVGLELGDSAGEGLMPKAGESPEMGSNPVLGLGRVYALP